MVVKHKYFPVLLTASMGVVLSCADSSDSAADFTIDWDDVECSSAQLADIYSEIEFIPLENKREGMLSNVKTIDVTDDGIVVFHRTPHPAVSLFGMNGRFVRNIGSLGHARDEYQDNVVCVASSPSGDTIAVVTYEGVKVYESSGKYLWSIEQEDDFMKNVVWTPTGYAFSTDYHGSDYALYVADKQFKKSKGWDANNGVRISDFGYCSQTLKSDQSYVYYCDQFKPSIYRVSLSDGNVVKEAGLTSRHTIRMEEYDKRADEGYVKDDVPIDCVWDFIPYNGKLCGQATLQGGKRCEFVMDMDKETVKLYEMDSWIPPHSAVHGAISMPCCRRPTLWT